MSQERLQVGGPPGRTWHVSPAPCLKNVMPLSQTARLHQSSLVWGTHLGDTSVTQFILLLFTISLEYSGPQRLKVIHLYNLKHTHSLSLHR